LEICIGLRGIRGIRGGNTIDEGLKKWGKNYVVKKYKSVPLIFGWVIWLESNAQRMGMLLWSMSRGPSNLWCKSCYILNLKVGLCRGTNNLVELSI
jgi:hypothetical protein